VGVLVALLGRVDCDYSSLDSDSHSHSNWVLVRSAGLVLLLVGLRRLFRGRGCRSGAGR
jgi:hypothetical protein